MLKRRRENKKVYLRIPGCLLFLILSQSSFGWSVMLHRPPPERLYVEDLWKADVKNQENEPVRVRLKVEVKEQNGGLIFQGVSNDITIPAKARKRITSKEITEVKETRYKPEYEEQIKKTGKFPAGSYRICMYVLRYRDNSLLAKDCIFHRVTLPCPPRLISPSSGDTIVKPRPLFQWTPPIPLLAGLRVRYRLKVCEIYEDQNPYEAINNIPHYENKNLISTSFQYPVGAKAFEDGKSYCWQVQAVDEDGFPIGGNDGKSEIRYFTKVSLRDILLDDKEKKK